MLRTVLTHTSAFVKMCVCVCLLCVCAFVCVQLTGHEVEAPFNYIAQQFYQK